MIKFFISIFFLLFLVLVLGPIGIVLAVRKRSAGRNSELQNNAEQQALPNQTIIINQQQSEKKSNGIGIAGFVIALVGFLLSWVPVLGWILWVNGLIFSFAGVFKEPRGLAIAGLAISLFVLILLITVIATISAAIDAALGFLS